MAKKIEEQPDKGKEGKEEKKPATEAREPKAFEQMQQLGYPRYTFALRFEQRDLNIDPRPYAIAKKVDVMTIKEENGKAPYVGLGFIGILDEQLFLIVMEKKMAIASAAEIKNMSDYIGLEFIGLSRFGPVGSIVLPKETYLKFAEAL